jgi:hypothetical protein
LFGCAIVRPKHSVCSSSVHLTILTPGLKNSTICSAKVQRRISLWRFCNLIVALSHRVRAPEAAPTQRSAVRKQNHRRHAKLRAEDILCGPHPQQNLIVSWHCLVQRYAYHPGTIYSSFLYHRKAQSSVQHITIHDPCRWWFELPKQASIIQPE